MKKYYSILVYSDRTDLQDVYTSESSDPFEKGVKALYENFEHLDNVVIDLYFNMNSTYLPSGITMSDLPYSYILEFENKADYDALYSSPNSAPFIFQKHGVPTLSEVNKAFKGKNGILPFGLGLLDMPDWLVGLFSQFWKYIRLIIIYLVFLFIIASIYIKWRLR